MNNKWRTEKQGISNYILIGTIIFAVSLWATILYVAYHFVAKYW